MYIGYYGLSGSLLRQTEEVVDTTPTLSQNIVHDTIGSGAVFQHTELTTTNQISDTDHKCRNLALEPIARNIHWEFKGKNLYSGERSVSNSKPFNWQNWPTDKLSQALLTAYPLESASSSANPEDRFTMRTLDFLLNLKRLL